MLKLFNTTILHRIDVPVAITEHELHR